MKALQELKQQLKDLAYTIRSINNGNDEDNSIYNDFCRKYGFVRNGGFLYIPGGPSYQFRHHHIAYCELRGRSRNQIEQPAENNTPDEKYIEQIKNKWLEKIHEETLHINS